MENLVFQEKAFKLLYLINCAVYLIKTYNIYATQVVNWRG